MALREIRLLPLVAAFIAFILSAAIAFFVGQRAQYQEREIYEATALHIEERVGAHIIRLNAIAGTIVALDTIPERTFFAELVESMMGQSGMAGAQGYGFAERISASTPADAILRVQRGYDMVRAPWPATTQPLRYPIVLLEPQDRRNALALNYDMYSESIRREAIEKAVTSGRTAVSSVVELVQEGLEAQRQRGFLLYTPVTLKTRAANTAPSQQATPVGLVYAPFRAGDLIEDTLDQAQKTTVAIRVYSDRIAPENLLYASNFPLEKGTAFPIRVADRTWYVLAGPGPEEGRINPAVFVLLFGVLLAGAVGALANENLKKLEATRQLALEMQAHAEQRNLMLGEMQHRIKNSIARMMALFRLTARETSGRDDLVSLFDDRLQTMARAQNLLISETSEARTLKDVVLEEMRQWQREGLAEIIDGPVVQLRRSQTHALLLVLHELSTNALKYGALAAGLPVSVHWRQEPDGDVILTWDEVRDVGQAPASVSAGSGFGSRFLRMMIEGQLGGRYERELTDTAFRMIIRFPLQDRATGN
ncbi:MAG: CHASE domain-containing protein [Proteobacteria bacterium]|nr:CHASE domain-containing protein [Pseudomonadota bacterium]